VPRRCLASRCRRRGTPKPALAVAANGPTRLDGFGFGEPEAEIVATLRNSACGERSMRQRRAQVLRRLVVVVVVVVIQLHDFEASRVAELKLPWCGPTRPCRGSTRFLGALRTR